MSLVSDAIRSFNAPQANFGVIPSLANSVSGSISDVGNIFSRIAAQRQQQEQFEREQMFKEMELAEKSKQFGYNLEENRLDRESREKLAREDNQNRLDVANLNHRNAINLQRMQRDREADRARAWADALKDTGNIEKEYLTLSQKLIDERNNSDVYKRNITNMSNINNSLNENTNKLREAQTELDKITATPEKMKEIEDFRKKHGDEVARYARLEQMQKEGLLNPYAGGGVDLRGMKLLEEAKRLGINPNSKYSPYIKPNEQGGVDIDMSTNPELLERYRFLKDTVDNSQANINALTEARNTTLKEINDYDQELMKKYSPQFDSLMDRGLMFKEVTEKDAQGNEITRKVPTINPLKQQEYRTRKLASYGFEVPEKNLHSQILIENNRNKSTMSDIERILLTEDLRDKRENKKRWQELKKGHNGSIVQALSKRGLKVNTADQGTADDLLHATASAYERAGINNFKGENIANAIDTHLMDNELGDSSTRKFAHFGFGPGENDVKKGDIKKLISDLNSCNNRDDLKKLIKRYKDMGSTLFNEKENRFHSFLMSNILDSDFWK